MGIFKKLFGQEKQEVKCDTELKSELFLLQIQDVFDIKQRGVIVVGRVSSGMCSCGEVVLIDNKTRRFSVKIVGIEKSDRKQHEHAVYGENVGLMLEPVGNANLIDLVQEVKKIEDFVVLDRNNQVQFQSLPILLDSVDYYYQEALSLYKKTHQIEGDINDQQKLEIRRCATNHIGLMITWIFDRDFYPENIYPKYVDGIKAGSILGVDYILDCLHGKFLTSDAHPVVYDFLMEYYKKQYFIDYAKWLSEKTNYSLFEVVSTCDQYKIFKEVIDDAYEDFLADMIVNQGKK